MPRKKKQDGAQQLDLLEAQVKTAPCVPALREAVGRWREGGYQGVTATTRALFNYWFFTDHRRADGSRFAYHSFQREALETLVYLFEVEQIRRHKDLLERYATSPDLRLLMYDEFARYAVKMATGSGKTKVMALAILWHYFNAVAEAREDFAKTFLLIAPNVIVFERLHGDFAGARIFRADPMIPPELQVYWDFQTYTRGEGERASSLGALYLTNVQQLYDARETDDDEPDAMTAVLGPKPKTTGLTQAEPFEARIVRRGGPVLVLNDEAHHTHDEESEWNQGIRRLHALLAAASDGSGTAGRQGLGAQLDFSATPRYSKGGLFTWTIYDYPLKQAILDNIVKQPIKGIAKGIQEQPSEIANVKYQPYLVAGVERWREYRKELAPLGRKPVLFVMLNDTKEADDVGDWMRVKFPEDFGGERLLIIHTNKSGDVAVKDLDAARNAARHVDDEKSPVQCIVSVLMLREGWDVQNVTVVVGLRPYTSKANILPEQTIGRGLRLMFRQRPGDYRERVDIIGNKPFIEFLEKLEREEEIVLDTFDVGKDKLHILTIQPEAAKAEMDIVLPSLTPILTRKRSLADEIAALDVSKLTCPVLPRKPSDASAQSFRYEGYDFLTLEKMFERDYQIPTPQTPEEVIGYYARRIALELKLPSQFAALVPKVREFLATRAFGGPVDLRQPELLKAISNNVAHYVTVRTFGQALRPLLVEELQPELKDAGRKLSETPPFPYSRPTVAAAKTVFNLVPCDNQLEKRFAEFLESAEDVQRFAKLPSKFGFSIEYTDATGNLRYYEPDFVAVAVDQVHYLLETKGQEDRDVIHKDRAAGLWCESATLLTGETWRYIKVPQKDFEQLRPDSFADLTVFYAG